MILNQCSVCVSYNITHIPPCAIIICEIRVKGVLLLSVELTIISVFSIPAF